MTRIHALVLLLLFSPAPALACGPDSDCTVGDRSYRIRMPDSHDGKTPVGAIVHAHGYKGTARGVMANKRLARMASDLGVALIAAQSTGNDWVIPNAPRKRQADGKAEFDYFEALAEDATARFPIDRQRMLMSGFSAGGMMVWTLACYRGSVFASYAPFSGTFWAPVPDHCPGDAVNLIHTHGTTDKVVPLEGRPIADTRQGVVRTAVSLFARSGEFRDPSSVPHEALDCERQTNRDGKILELCLHSGGHVMEPEWLSRAWREFEATGAL